MIRKPGAEEFREGTAVTVLRETKKIAVEGGAGARQGLSRLARVYLIGIFGFGFVASALPYLAGSGWLWLIAIVAFIAIMLNRRSQRPDRRKSLIPDTVERAPSRIGSASLQAGEYQYDIASLVRQAISLAIPAVILFILGSLFPFRVPMFVIGIMMFALAVLLIVRIFEDRTAVRFDEQAITARGLLGDARLLWADVEDVYVHKFSLFDIKTLFTTGARRNIVVEAVRNRLGGPARLLVPIDLLGLKQEELVSLVTKFLSCRAAGGEMVPDGRGGPVAAPAPDLSKVSPAGDPRASFDPDAIMARYMAERDQIIAENRPDGHSAVPGRRTFGRKIS